MAKGKKGSSGAGSRNIKQGHLNSLAGKATKRTVKGTQRSSGKKASGTTPHTKSGAGSPTNKGSY